MLYIILVSQTGVNLLKFLKYFPFEPRGILVRYQLLDVLENKLLFYSLTELHLLK